MPSFNRRCIVIERGSIFLTASVCSYERFGSIALLSYRICPFFSGDLEISRRRVSFQKRATPNKPTRQHTNTKLRPNQPVPTSNNDHKQPRSYTKSTAITTSTPNGQHTSTTCLSILSKNVRGIRLRSMVDRLICVGFALPFGLDSCCSTHSYIL